MRLAIGVVQLGGALAVLAVLGGGLALLASASIRAGAGGARRAFGRALVAFAVFLGLLAAAGLGLLRPLNTALGPGPASLVWALALLASVAAGVALVARALRHAAPDPGAVRLSILLGWGGVAAMALATIGSLWLALAISAEAPDRGAPLLPVVVLGAAAGWSGTALLRIRSAGPGTLQPM